MPLYRLPSMDGPVSLKNAQGRPSPDETPNQRGFGRPAPPQRLGLCFEVGIEVPATDSRVAGVPGTRISRVACAAGRADLLVMHVISRDIFDQPLWLPPDGDRRLPHTHVPAEHPLLLPRENGRGLDSYAVTRILNRVARAAGLPHIHPHQLRHTQATQAINRGKPLEAIAAMLGHRGMDMTLRYAKIANRTVADEYFAVTEKVDALGTPADPLPADAIGPKMARLRREHHRLLGNGHCTRPAELDSAFESICETCIFFQASIEFRPTLQTQHDDAAAKGQDPPCQPLQPAPQRPHGRRSIMNSDPTRSWARCRHQCGLH